MAAHQTTPPPTQYSPLILQDMDDGVPSNGCGCFRVFGFRSSRNGGYEREEESWMVRKLKKMKEVSEVVAGPKWKNFIRKIGGFLKGKKQRNRFQYDAESYALNFDGDDDCHPIGFSSRFAVPLPSSNEQH